MAPMLLSVVMLNAIALSIVAPILVSAVCCGTPLSLVSL
jgi:hypothetical protein